MSVFDRLKKFFNKIVGKEEPEVKELTEGTGNIYGENGFKKDDYIPLDLPEGELVSAVEEGFIDTTTKEFEQKFKHNLELLVSRAKEAGKVDKFMLIREDDSLPRDWKWEVLSKNTGMDSVQTSLSSALRKAYAFREAEISELVLDGMIIPNSDPEKENEALGKVDKKLGSVLVPPHFRSTKHFTVNTPLEVTGNYNTVHVDRDFIVLDNIDNFMNSGYGYSLAYHDAYLDVAHEGLEVSKDGIVLINENNYDRVMSDLNNKKLLEQRNVIRYKGDTHLAIGMLLTENGALPSTVGNRYMEYDMETRDILDNSIMRLAQEKDLLYDKSHYASEGKGHFSSYYDEKNQDDRQSERDYIDFLEEKFPDKKELFERYLMDKYTANKVVQSVGIDELLGEIKEYNAMVNEKLSKRIEEYTRDRKTITPKQHEQFTEMVSLIDKFYRNTSTIENFEGKEDFEKSVKKFFQGDTVKEQQEGCLKAWDFLKERMEEKESVKDDSIIEDKKEEDFTK